MLGGPFFSVIVTGCGTRQLLLTVAWIGKANIAAAPRICEGERDANRKGGRQGISREGQSPTSLGDGQGDHGSSGEQSPEEVHFD